MAARAKTLLLLLAALFLPAFAHVPHASLLVQKPHQGVERFALPSHRGFSDANALKATGLSGCLCDEGARSRSTAKERDEESGLDYFGARYMSSSLGRFTSADAPFADQEALDPQSWNLYGYVRNNPLLYVDPTGQAIQLTGETEEERQAALDAIRASLVNSSVADRLSITQNDAGNFMVGIEGSVLEFQKAGDLEAGLGALIASDTVVDFGLSDTVERQSGPSWLPDFLSVQSLPVGERFGGEVVDNVNVTPSGRITVTIDPNDIRDRQAGREGIPGATLGETTAHGLGHAQSFVQGVIGAGNDKAAVGAENAARSRGGPQRRQKQRHNDVLER